MVTPITHLPHRPGARHDRSEPESRALARATLRNLRSEYQGKPIPNQIVAYEARQLGVCSSTLRNWLGGRTDPFGVREGHELTTIEKVCIAAHGGKVQPAHRALCAAGLEPPVRYRQFAQLWKDVPEYEKTYLIEGTQAAKRWQRYARWDIARRNELAFMDAWTPNIRVRHPDARADTPDKDAWCYPTVIAIMDGATRVPLAVSVVYSPELGKRKGGVTAEQAAALVSQAVRLKPVNPATLNLPWDYSDVDPQELFIGGRPEALVPDNDRALSGVLSKKQAADVGYLLDVAQEFKPEDKARVERWFGTLENGTLYLLDGQTHGPERRDGKKLFADGPVTPKIFEAELFEQIRTYTFHTVHSALGMTPFEAWCRNGAPLRAVDDETLSTYLMPHPYRSGRRTVGKFGIEANNAWYWHAALVDVTGEVEIRVEPCNIDFVDVWKRDLAGNLNYLCRAMHWDLLSTNDRKRVAILRGEQAAAVRPLRNAAVEARRLFTEAVAERGPLKPAAIGLFVQAAVDRTSPPMETLAALAKYQDPAADVEDLLQDPVLADLLASAALRLAEQMIDDATARGSESSPELDGISDEEAWLAPDVDDPSEISTEDGAVADHAADTSTTPEATNVAPFPTPRPTPPTQAELMRRAAGIDPAS